LRSVDSAAVEKGTARADGDAVAAVHRPELSGGCAIRVRHRGSINAEQIAAWRILVSVLQGCDLATLARSLAFSAKP